MDTEVHRALDVLVEDVRTGFLEEGSSEAIVHDRRMGSIARDGGIPALWSSEGEDTRMES
jgi:hypothetical protein